MRFLLLLSLYAAYACTSGVSYGESLSEAVFESGLKHIDQHGPDIGTEQFFIYTNEPAWQRRVEVLELLSPHLKSKKPEAVSGAIRAFYRLRFTGQDIAKSVEAEQVVAEFYKEMDKVVYEEVEHYFALCDDSILHSLALYCGRAAYDGKQHVTDDAKRTLLRIIQRPDSEGGKSQALTCLAWHADPSDMNTLSAYMLEDSSASSSLPYQFLSSYGRASIPYLKKAIADAERASTRLQAAFQLVRLREPSGFQYLISQLEEDPEPAGKMNRLAAIRQFARDYLDLPKLSTSAKAVTEHLLMVQQESYRAAAAE